MLNELIDSFIKMSSKHTENNKARIHQKKLLDSGASKGNRIYGGTWS